MTVKKAKADEKTEEKIDEKANEKTYKKAEGKTDMKVGGKADGKANVKKEGKTDRKAEGKAEGKKSRKDSNKSQKSQDEKIELIICEKPKSAQKIALALGNPKKESIGKVSYYTLHRNGKEIIVASTVGHIFGLAETEKSRWTYPVFNVSWKPLHEVSKGSEFTKKYLEVLKKLAKNAQSFVIGTDYDVEGSVIGYNIVRFVCNREDAKRMKFSTLTKKELEYAYENASQHLDFAQAIAGETRHYLDYFYGINLSRALTSAVKTSGLWHVLSSGRVQGPALKIIVDREVDIRAFIPKAYWEIAAEVKHQNAGHKTETGENSSFTAMHENGKFFEKAEAEAVFAKVEGQKKGIVAKSEAKQFLQSPPSAFDLTTLQTEAYRAFRVNPKDTLAIAQELYTSGYISYPRTSSEKLPKSIGYEEIIDALSNQAEYAELCKRLLKSKEIRELKPVEGEGNDPAHPAIFPTGDIPKKLNEREEKIYDLIIRRFLSAFSEPAKRETVSIKIDINNEIFEASGTRTVEKGWHDFYGPYVSLKEVELPHLKLDEEVEIEKTSMDEKQTEPPKRYTPASIIRELEKRELGTKATRAQIVDTLYQRRYVVNESLQATELGIATVQALQKYCPEILDEELTRHFEKEMDLVRESKKTKDEVVNEAKEVLTKILADFKKKEKSIGEALGGATKETREEMNIVGVCPKCGKGKLRIIYMRGRGTKFVGCNAYPACKTTFSLPRDGLVKPTKNLCKRCNYPIVTVIRKARRPWQLCLNPECPEKAEWASRKESSSKEIKDGHDSQNNQNNSVDNSNNNNEQNNNDNNTPQE